MMITATWAAAADLMVATFKYNIFGLSSVLRIFSANVPALELYGGFFFISFSLQGMLNGL